MKEKRIDYGADPLGDGMHQMVPSGDIVDTEERKRRLDASRPIRQRADCLGMTWDEIERRQGGKLSR